MRALLPANCASTRRSVLSSGDQRSVAVLPMFQSGYFVRSESEIGHQSDWHQPERCQLPLACHMHMPRLGSVAREEEEPIRTALENGRAHVA